MSLLSIVKILTISFVSNMTLVVNSTLGMSLVSIGNYHCVSYRMIFYEPSSSTI